MPKLGIIALTETHIAELKRILTPNPDTLTELEIELNEALKGNRLKIKGVAFQTHDRGARTIALELDIQEK